MDQITPQELYDKNQGLVYFMVSTKFPSLRFDEDTLQDGRVGLWKACLNYDSDKSKFATFASKCIFNEVLMVIRKKRVTTISLESPMGEKGVTLGDMLESPNDCFGSISLGGIDKLTLIQEKVLNLKIKGVRQIDIAKELGLSQTYISRILTKVEKILREDLG